MSRAHRARKSASCGGASTSAALAAQVTHVPEKQMHKQEMYSSATDMQLVQKEFGQLVRTGKRDVKGPNVKYQDKIM